MTQSLDPNRLPSQRISVRLSVKLLRLLRQFAENLHMTESEIVRRALERYFGEEGKP